MKKMLRALLLISAAVFTFWSVWYVRKSGVLRAYPDTSFMTKPNEELRVMYQNLSEKEKAVYTFSSESVSKINLLKAVGEKYLLPLSV